MIMAKKMQYAVHNEMGRMGIERASSFFGFLAYGFECQHDIAEWAACLKGDRRIVREGQDICGLVLSPPTLVQGLAFRVIR